MPNDESSTVGPPAPRPCETCPYRRDVPSGVWDTVEYERLPKYDGATPIDQPVGVFLCHQYGRGPGARLCAGWLGCHGGENLFALRFAVIRGDITPETHRAAVCYESPVALFASGAEAAAHGLADVERPGPRAGAAIAKLRRHRAMRKG